MLPDRVSNPGPLTYESGALPIALRGPAACQGSLLVISNTCTSLKQTEIVSFAARAKHAKLRSVPLHKRFNN